MSAISKKYKSTSSSETLQASHQGSTLNAGKVNLTTTESDLTLIGSTITAGNAKLDSAGNLSLLSAQDTMRQRSQNSNSGWSAGVFVGSSGGSYGFGVEGSAQVGKGYENSDSVTHVNSMIQAEKVEARSGQDMSLKGGVVTGNKVAVGVGNNFIIESRQDSQQYESKQTQAGVSAVVAIYGSGSNASVNGSLTQGKLNYAQVATQSGLHAGEAGLTVNVAGNTHLKGGIVDSQATAEKNHFSTGSLTAENIKNYSEANVESMGGGLSTDPTQNIANGFVAGLSALGNINKQDSTTTHSAIGSNINLTTQQGDVPTSLSRDTKAANEQVDKTEIADLKTRQEMAQVIGEIANNGITIVLKPKLDEAERQKAEAEAILKEDKTNAAALEQKRLANDVIKTYGQGSQIQLAVRAVTGVLQGIATGEATQAAVGGLSPYANQAIKQLTTDPNTGEVNTQANLMAHALLGAVEAYATGNNATAGAAGAVGGELAAKIITEQLYQKTPEQLTEAQKQTVTALSQLASGLAGGLISDNTAGAINSAEIGKRAVENNFLSEKEITILKKLAQKKVLTPEDVERITSIKMKDKVSNALLTKYQQDPTSLTPQEYQQLMHWVNESAAWQPETAKNILKMDVTGPAIEYSNPELDKKYQAAHRIYSSLDYQFGKSTLEGLAVLGNSGNAIIKGVTTVEAIGTIVAPTLQKVASNPVVQNTAIGLGANGAVQLVSGQEFNWYEFAGAGIASGVTHGMSLRNSIRTNMGISMGVSLASGGNPLQDTSLSGISTIISNQIKQPIVSAISSELIQKIPQIGNRILPSTNLEIGGNDEEAK